VQWEGIVPESGEVLTHHHHMFSKIDTTCRQIKMAMVAYLGGVWTLQVGAIIKLVYVTNGTSSIHETMQPRLFEQDGYGGVPRC